MNYINIKNKLVNFLINDKPFNISILLNNAIYNPLKLYNSLKSILNKIPNKFKNTKELKIYIQNNNELCVINLIIKNLFKSFTNKNKLFEYINNNFKDLEKDYMYMIYYNYDFKRILNELFFVLRTDFKTNDILTLYYKESFKLFGYDKKKDKYLSIKTNKYMKLSNDIYLIFNFNIEPYIINWVGINGIPTYNVLTLYKLNYKLFKEMYNDCLQLSIKQINKKYNFDNDTIIFNKQMTQYFYHMHSLIKSNINIKDEFNNLIKYINNNNTTYKLLYRGERRYENTNYTKNQIIEYKNIHTFSIDKQFALNFMNGNNVSTFDKNVKEYILYVLKNGKCAVIHPIYYNQCIDSYIIYNHYEYLHKPIQYKIIDIKTIKKSFKYYDKSIHTLTYKIIMIKEV